MQGRENNNANINNIENERKRLILKLKGEAREKDEGKAKREKRSKPAIAMPSLSSKKETCSFCGEDSQASSSTWVCEHCECVNSPATAIFLANQSLKEIQAKLNHGFTGMQPPQLQQLQELSSALLAYEQLAKSAQDNRFSYLLGTFYMRLSDLYLSKVGYSKSDFMYENALLKLHAAAAESKAKLFLFKASKPNEAAVESIFTSFMALLKLGMLNEAKSVLAKLDSLDSKHSLAGYARLLFSIETGEYQQAIAESAKLINENFSVGNVAYYEAFALYKLKRYNESLRILKKLAGILSNQNVEKLISIIGKEK